MDRENPSSSGTAEMPSARPARGKPGLGLPGWIFRTTKGLMLAASVVATVLVILTHTVGWAFDLTDMLLRKGLGMTTVSAQATAEVDELRGRVRTLETDLEKSKVELVETRARLTESDSLRASQDVRIRELDETLTRSRDELRSASSQLESIESRLAKQNDEVARLRSQQFVKFKGNEVSVREAAQITATSLRTRTATTATANAAATFGESIPFYGIGVIVAATSFEIAMACEDMKDLYELQIALDPESAVPEDRDKVCGLQVPTRQEIWETIKTSPAAAWNLAGDALNSAGAKVSDLSMPDFSGAWSHVIALWDGTAGWFGSWFE